MISGKDLWEALGTTREWEALRELERIAYEYAAVAILSAPEDAVKKAKAAYEAVMEEFAGPPGLKRWSFAEMGNATRRLWYDAIERLSELRVTHDPYWRRCAQMSFPVEGVVVYRVDNQELVVPEQASLNFAKDLLIRHYGSPFAAADHLRVQEPDLDLSSSSWMAPPQEVK